MQLIVFRGYFLLLAILTTGFVLGQQPVRKDSVSTSFQIAPGNVSSKKQTRHITRRPSPVTSIFQDIPLRRLKSVTNTFPPGNAGDTIRISAVSKTGIPLKLIRLMMDQQTLLEWKDTAAFQYEAVLLKPGSPVLVLQQKPNPRVQTAAVNLRYAPPAQFDTVSTSQNVLVSVNKSGMADSVFTRSVTALNGKEILTYWKGTVPTDRSNEMIYRTQKLSIRPKSALQGWVQPSRIVRLRNWKKVTLPYHTGFQKGDTLIFTVTAMGKTLLKSCVLQDQDLTILRSVRDVPAFADTLIVQNETAFQLSMQGKLTMKKKYAQVAILRIRPVAPDSFYVFTDSLFRIEHSVLYDTLVLNVFDDSLELHPIWNIEQAPFGEFKVQVPTSGPKLGQLSYIIYWLGIGRPASEEFQRLEAVVPPEWSRPGAFASLGAIGFGHNLGFSEQYPAGVRFASTTPQDRPRFLAGKKLLSAAPVANMQKQNFGKVQASAMTKDLKQSTDPKTGISTSTFYVCFENKSTVSPFPVSLKLVGFYLMKKAETTTNQWLKTEFHELSLAKWKGN